MHRALSVPDIISLICDAAGSAAFSPSELLNLALASSAFSSPALDVAWGQRKLTFADLCSDVGISRKNWDSSSDKDVDGLRYITSNGCRFYPLVTETARTWDRLFYYASKTRSLELKNEGVPSFVYKTVATKQAESSTPLFPHMETLQVTFPLGDWRWPLLRPFCGPKLSTLRFKVPGLFAELDLTPLIHMSSLIHSVCPQVINLDFIGPWTSFLGQVITHPFPMEKPIFVECGLWKSVLTLISHTNGWRNLDLNLQGIPSTSKYVEMLSRLPLLETLVLHHPPPYHHTITESKPVSMTKVGRATFQVLRSLSLTGRAPFLNTFLNGLASPKLETLQLQIALDYNDWRHEAEALQAVITSLVDSQSPNASFRAFKLSVRKTIDYITLNAVIPMSILSPLYAVTNLQDVELCFEIGVYMDDAQVEALASAWPSLRRLILPRPSKGSVSPSLSCLHTLALHCPELMKLSLTVKPDAPFSSGPFNTPCSEHGLGVLVIRLVEADSSTSLADWVPKLFPFARINFINEKSEKRVFKQK